MTNASFPRRAMRLVTRRALPLLALTAACHTHALPAAVQGVAVPRVDPPADGRGTVTGIVADSASGYPVVGASVYFTRDSVIGTGPARPRTDLPRATTDRSGGFVLRDIPPGEYTLAFSDLDHFPMRTLVIVRAGLVHSVVLRPRRRDTP
jgi:hypothetical protein